jgi:ABC-2 type transport system ATP-binding protein
MPASKAKNGDIAIEVEGLTKSFSGKVVVRDLSMRVKRGQIYGFLGPNGSGKTTTLRMLCGLLTPDSGRGTALGYDIRTGSDEIKRHVGYMTQRFSLYQDLSILENLEFVARVYGLADPTQEARDAIERLGLQGRERQLAGELSGGWKQRLALGACILPRPELLLLDEPTAGMSPQETADTIALVGKIVRERGLTLLFTEHDMDVVFGHADRVIVLDRGTLIAEGTPAQVRADPQVRAVYLGSGTTYGDAA